MPKFSIIIPVYNSEKYLERCLTSVLNQSFKDFEIIVINDASTDNSMDIIDKYKNKLKVHNVKKKNAVGPSYARNLGIKKAKGEYILFLDSDDYYENDLLKKLNDNMNYNYDVIRFEIQYDHNGEKERIIGSKEDISFENGVDAFNEICTYSIVESPCCYAFNRNYFLNNNFKFLEGTLHEDFGLIPITIIMASKVKCLSYIGYNYVIHDNSIMTNNDYEKILKKANDLLLHFKFISEKSKYVKGDLSVFNSFIANSLILKSTTLKYKDYKSYVKKLKKLNVFDMLLDDTPKRKKKNLLLKISPKFYYKIVRR